MRPLHSAAIERYLLDLAPPRDPVLAEMEALAAERDIPIVGPLVGRLLQILAAATGARHAVEMGSAIGYSTAWLARAVGPGGRVLYTDADPLSAASARDYLGRMRLLDRVDLHVGDALERVARAPVGSADLVFIDVDKRQYPQALDVALRALRRGGLLVVDNTLWSGRVADPAARDADTEGVRELNRRVAALPGASTAILPLRDGVSVTLVS